MEVELVWIPLVLGIGAFAMVSFIVWAITTSRQQVARSRADVQMKVIEKFGSAAELSDFLNSETGMNFVNSNAKAPAYRSRARLIASFRSSMILTFMGLAFIIVPAMMREHGTGMFLAGAILLAIGLGMLLSTLLSLKLSRAWGLMPDEEKNIPPSGTA